MFYLHYQILLNGNFSGTCTLRVVTSPRSAYTQSRNKIQLIFNIRPCSWFDGCVGHKPLCTCQINGQRQGCYRQMALKAGDQYANVTVQAVLTLIASLFSEILFWSMPLDLPREAPVFGGCFVHY